jgi:hypothetical protein
VSLSDIVTITVTTTGAGVTRAGYGVPLILSYTANSIFGTDVVRTYERLSDVDDDFSTNSPEYMAAAKIFGQSPKVEQIMIGKATLPPTQRFAIGVQSVATGTLYAIRTALATGSAWVEQDAEYNSGAGATVWTPSGLWSRGDLITNDSGKLYSCLGQSGNFGGFGNATGFTAYGGQSGPTGTDAAIRDNQIYWMYAGAGNTGSVSNDSIINGVRAKVDYLFEPSFVGTGSGQMTSSLQGSAGSRTMRLLANDSNKFFGLQVYSRAALNIAQDHSDPGVATDLALVVDDNNDWYGLVTLFNSESYVAAAAAWVESNTKLYPAASLDSAIARTALASATDIAKDLKDLGYDRSWVIHHPSNDQFADAAELGKWFPVSPGGETWRMKTLTGVTAESYTSTERTNMKAKYAHFYYTVGGVPVVGGDAKAASGEYIDTTRFIDWYTSELQAKLANLVIGTDKLPFTNPGIDAVEAKVRQQNAEGIRAGGIAADPEPIVTVPDVADVSAEDKAARTLNDVETEWTLAGAIHKITVRVTASV